MLKRIITAAITAPIAVLVILLGGMVMQVVATLLILIGMRELYHSFNRKWLPVHFVGYAFALVYMAFIQTFMQGNGFFLFFIAFILIVLMTLVLFHDTVNAQDCAVTVFGFFYVCMLLSTVYMVRDINTVGAYVIWMVFFSAWGADTGAYFAGYLFGKRKLTKLSPKKTVEGAIGGVIVVAAISAIYGLVLERMGLEGLADVEVSLVFALTVIGAGGAILSIFGDLAASAIKRCTGIKDFGNLLPGHGGIIDRFDSVLFTAPAVYLLTVFILG